MKISLTFRWKVFILYSLFVSSLILGLTVSFYIYTSSILIRNSFNSMDQSVKRISQQLDTLIESMDNMSNIILYNRDLQNILIDILAFQESDVNYFDINPDQKRKVNDILFSVLGTKNIPRRVCIFNGRQNYISLSTIPENSIPLQLNLQNLPWLGDINQKNVYSIILPPHKDIWMSETDTSYVISFVRKILSTIGNNAPLGYIEIQQPYSMIENICKPSISGNTKIFIKTDKGEIVYPFNTNDAVYSEYYFNQSIGLQSTNSSTIKNPENNQQELIYSIVSPVAKWTVLQIMPKKDFMASVNRFQQIIILIGGLLIIGSLIIMFFITNSLTSPIRKLRESLKDVSLQNPSLDINLQENNNEILLFQSAFKKTLQRLHESMNQTIHSRSKEFEAHFLALQAQMDPHFLYNSLMGISAVGQEYNNPKVVEMCTMLSRMLRYSASYNSSIVDMSEEIKYAKNYINMLKYRYEDTLHFEFLFDSGMENIKVPKLVIQPLLENSISHGFKNKKPPYQLHIKGVLFDDSWTVSISDNGLGFSKSSLEIIKKQIEKYDESLRKNNYENKLEVGGMAIFNIYVRLKIIYGNNAIFSISDNGSIGSKVTIGGKIM